MRLSPEEVGLPNSTSDVGQVFSGVITTIFAVIGALAVIFIIVGGIQIATAAGNPARYKQGRETVIYSAVGLVAALMAYGVVTFIAGVFN